MKNDCMRSPRCAGRCEFVGDEGAKRLHRDVMLASNPEQPGGLQSEEEVEKRARRWPRARRREIGAAASERPRSVAHRADDRWTIVRERRGEPEDGQLVGVRAKFLVDRAPCCELQPHQTDTEKSETQFQFARNSNVAFAASSRLLFEAVSYSRTNDVFDDHVGSSESANRRCAPCCDVDRAARGASSPPVWSRRQAGAELKTRMFAPVSARGRAKIA